MHLKYDIFGKGTICPRTKSNLQSIMTGSGGRGEVRLNMQLFHEHARVMSPLRSAVHMQANPIQSHYLTGTGSFKPVLWMT